MPEIDLGVSVLICCYNSAHRLPETLRHLALQKVPTNINWEIIVIDNASTDDTYTTALTEWKKHASSKISFQVIEQPIAGLRHARRKGIKTACYEFILFCDDDNWFSENYITKVYELMISDPNIGALGGRANFKAEEPIWKDIENYKSRYVNGSQIWATDQHWVYGAGCTYRKSGLFNLYLNNWQEITTGRKGSKLLGGEDVEICFMLYLSGYKIVADDTLLFDHFVPLNRQNIQYLFNLKYGTGYSYVLLNNYLMLIENDKRGVSKKLIIWFLFTLKKIFILIVKICYRCLSQRQMLSVEDKFEIYANWGTLMSLINNYRQIIKHHHQLNITLKNIFTKKLNV